ncbi:MAG: hypothetical protein MUC96_28015 [Myxococcaceae bacterium]|jgi:hypothetical protein|nr:hypothetical protein [Myxococcaceae bacterium]
MTTTLDELLLLRPANDVPTRALQDDVVARGVRAVELSALRAALAMQEPTPGLRTRSPQRRHRPRPTRRRR